MKNITKLFAIATVVLGFATTSFAQPGGATATATASGTIITPISITKNVDMNFGNIAVNATAGTVVLDNNDARTATGGVTLPAVTGTVKSAQFTVTGTADYLYTFTLPSIATTVSNGTNNMTIDNFTSNSHGVLTGGTDIVKVGATINVGANQAAGLYTSATPFIVRVDYN